jgi:hypothetical protein
MNSHCWCEAVCCRFSLRVEFVPLALPFCGRTTRGQTSRTWGVLDLRRDQALYVDALYSSDDDETLCLLVTERVAATKTEVWPQGNDRVRLVLLFRGQGSGFSDLQR